MRKLIYSINFSIDGCVDHTKINGSEEILEYFGNMLRNADVLIYGRITYQLMVPFWPEIAKNHSGPTKGMNDYADAFESIDKIIVVSRTLEKAEGKNTRIIRTNLKEEILKLKQEDGKDILLGGVDLPSQLIDLDVIDEYRFVVHPVITGEGRRLFADTRLHENLKLNLIDTQVLRSGCVVLRYAKA